MFCGRQLQCFFIIAVLGLCGAQTRAAIHTDFNFALQQGAGNGFGFSYLHNADGSGTGANRNGQVAQIGGAKANTLTGDYDTDTQILTITGSIPSPINHDSLTLDDGSVLNANSLSLTSGKLIINNDWAGGFINYSALIDGNTESGSFYFANRREAGTSTSPKGSTPNSGTWDGTTINFALWGNNWTYSGGGVDWSFLVALNAPNVDSNGLDYSNASGPRLGIDLRAAGVSSPSSSSVPEPGAAWVWLIGLVAAGAVGKKSRCNSAAS